MREIIYMNKDEFKLIFSKYMNSMFEKWFDTSSINDILCKSLAQTLVKANINKYDSYIDYFSDESGDVLIDDILDNLIDNFSDINIDLTKYNIPFLPNKILILSKQDLFLLKNMCISHGSSYNKYNSEDLYRNQV